MKRFLFGSVSGRLEGLGSWENLSSLRLILSLLLRKPFAAAGFSFFAQRLRAGGPSVYAGVYGGGIIRGLLFKRGTGGRFACYFPSADLLDGQMREAVAMVAIRVRRYLSRGQYGGWYSKALVVGFLPLLFLLASCGGGGGDGGGGGGSQGALSVELAFAPGDGGVTVNLVEKGPLVQLLNISAYQLTAIDSANETISIEGERLAEGAFNGSTLMGLTNDRNYTFTLQVFYFPVGSAELSSLSVRVDYAEEANARNAQAGGGITIGSNRDGDYLADSLDADDDNDGLNDLDANGMALDDCPRGDIGWRSGKTTDNDGDGCRDEGEDNDDDNDEVGDSMDDCPRGDIGWQSDKMTDNDGDGCRDAGDEDGDDDNDEVGDSMDDCPRGDIGWLSSLTTDNDDDGCRDAGEDRDDDNDGVLDGADLGTYMDRECRLFADCDDDGEGDGLDVDIDGDRLIEIETAAELDAVRHQLNGSGRRLSAGGTLNSTGCGDNSGITEECRGYELVGDISLAAYAGGDGWVPLGADTDSAMNECQGTPFSGIFDGNGWTVSELNISRSGEDCIGLFGHLAAGTVIRNLAVKADSVKGGKHLGGLVGWGNNAKVVSSSSVAGEVISGSGFEVGGLVGRGENMEIVSSSSVAGEVSGDRSNVGGLIGRGNGAKIVSSFSVAGAVSGGGAAGGLAGEGSRANIVSSFSVAGAVSGGGGNGVGGLVGGGEEVEIALSSAVAGTVSGEDASNSYAGGLVGDGENADIVSSFSVAGELSGSRNIGGLVGRGDTVDFSYWHTAVSVADNDKGEEKTLAELRTPTNGNAYDAGGIYADWAMGADINGDMSGVEDITKYCDEDLSGAIETAEMRDGGGSGGDNRIWDFGGTNDYPAIRCLPLSLAEQRSWWSINTGTNRPQINQDRLNMLTSP